MECNGGRDHYLVDGAQVDLAEYPWDILVILDACRYDQFKQVYRDYIPGGRLRKAYSPATHTPEFLWRCFGDRHLDDTIYVSSNAYCNNRNVPVTVLDEHEFNPTRHFGRVIDVWYDGWSEEHGTVHPGEVTKRAMASLDLHPIRRHIVHYMQPHTPYIVLGEQSISGGRETRQRDRDTAAKRIINNERERLYAFASKVNQFVPDEWMWRAGSLLGKLPEGGYGSLWMRYGTDGMREHYRAEIRLALSYVRRLLAAFPSKGVLVTSDHGERLGEGGNWLHSKIKRRDEAILAVPWLEVGL